MANPCHLTELLPLYPIGFPKLEGVSNWLAWDKMIKAHLVVHKLRFHLNYQAPKRHEHWADPRSGAKEREDNKKWLIDDLKVKLFILDSCSVFVRSDIEECTSAAMAYGKLQGKFEASARVLFATDTDKAYSEFQAIKLEQFSTPTSFVAKFRDLYGRLAIADNVAVSNRQAVLTFIKAVEKSYSRQTGKLRDSLEKDQVPDIVEVISSFWSQTTGKKRDVASAAQGLGWTERSANSASRVSSAGTQSTDKTLSGSASGAKRMRIGDMIYFDEE